MNRLKPILKKRNINGRYYKQIKYPEVPLSFNDIYIITKVEDRLDLLAEQFYNDISLWWVIATANPDVVKRDSFFTPVGVQLRIPADTQSIIDSFNRLNA
jgi:hypothetical protein